jgi:putative glutathione S-transferase
MNTCTATGDSVRWRGARLQPGISSHGQAFQSIVAAMGALVDGVWHPAWSDVPDATGKSRQGQQFRARITEDGSGGFKAEPGRYHLYASLACPWSHRGVIARTLLGLRDVIGLSYLEPVVGNDGWVFSGRWRDPLYGSDHLYDLYRAAKPNHTGRATLPVLWDRFKHTIVSNDSGDILCMLGLEFTPWCATKLDLYPKELRGEIDVVNSYVQERVAQGVYTADFAANQESYDTAVRALFSGLDGLERRVARQPWLTGQKLTEADVRLFVALVRFDVACHGIFKCNVRRLADYPALTGWLRAFYQQLGVADTVDFAHIKAHYYGSFRELDPTGIVPLGPAVDFTLPDERVRSTMASGIHAPDPL